MEKPNCPADDPLSNHATVWLHALMMNHGNYKIAGSTSWRCKDLGLAYITP